jgi:hypothetical protein
VLLHSGLKLDAAGAAVDELLLSLGCLMLWL